MSDDAKANAEGTIPGLRVVGYHGRLGPRQTPTRRPPVYANEDGVPVRIRESKPEPGGGFSLKLDRGARPIPAQVWDSTGTRIEPPWPATLAAPMMLLLGERELRVVSALRHVVVADEQEQEQEQIAAFLRWVETETPRSDTLRCVRVGGLLVWNCTRALANALCARVAIVARGQVVDAARWGQMHELRRASFWLSRAALRDVDMFLAVAGLRRAGFERLGGVAPCWYSRRHAGTEARAGLEAYPRLRHPEAVGKAGRCLDQTTSPRMKQVA